MTNTKSFEILSIVRRSDSIFVCVDEDIPFANGTQNYMDLAGIYPFTSWQVGDSISIDLDRIRYKNSSEYINDSQIFYQNTYPCPEDYCFRKKAANDSCCNHHHRQFKNQVKQRTSIPSTIQDVAKFDAWWNNNLATVVNGDGYFTIYLLVYDDKDSRIRDFQSSSSNYDLGSAKGQALTLRTNLKGDNPILYIHPKANNYASFGEIINEYSDYIKKIHLPYSTENRTETRSFKDPTEGRQSYTAEKTIRVANKTPWSYLKPLDIVWVAKSTAGKSYYHVGVYLGSLNNHVCHYSGDDKKQYEARVIITSWDKFVEGCVGGEVFAYRAIIPFKHYKQIASQIAWARPNYGGGHYCLANNNCEHRANSFVYGINYSKQVEEKPSDSVNNCGKGYRTRCYGGCKNGIYNNSKGSINLTNEISQTNSQLYQNNNWEAVQIENPARNAVPPKNNSWL